MHTQFEWERSVIDSRPTKLDKNRGAESDLGGGNVRKQTAWVSYSYSKITQCSQLRILSMISIDGLF